MQQKHIAPNASLGGRLNRHDGFAVSSDICPHGEGQNVRGEPRIRDRALRNR